MYGRRSRGSSGVWYYGGLILAYYANGVCCCRFVGECCRRGKRGGKEEGKVEVAPGVTVGSLRRFRVALIGRT